MNASRPHTPGDTISLWTQVPGSSLQGGAALGARVCKPIPESQPGTPSSTLASVTAREVRDRTVTWVWLPGRR